MNSNVIIVRAFKTFIQAFGAVFLAGLVTATDRVTFRALVVGAFAAGVSALMNLFIQPSEAK